VFQPVNGFTARNRVLNVKYEDSAFPQIVQWFGTLRVGALINHDFPHNKWSVPAVTGTEQGVDSRGIVL